MIVGNVKVIAPKTYCWYLGGQYPFTMLQSPSFLPSDSLNTFCFLIKKYNSHPSLLEKLYLCSTPTGNLPKTYDFHIKLEYTLSMEEFSVRGVVSSKKNNLDVYYLKDIVTLTLIQITCTFFEREESSAVGHETEIGNNFIFSSLGEKKEQSLMYNVKAGMNEQLKPKDENYEDEEKEKSLMNNTEEDENMKAGMNKELKPRGSAAVCENLKDVFLSEECSDVTLKVGDQKYPVHRVILMARSPVFRAMLKHDMKEKNEGVVDIADCHPHIFRDFLFFLYTAKRDNFSKENVFELYHMSDKYDVEDLKMECVDFILKNLAVDVICDVISLASRHCERNLLARATEFFIDNANDILTTVSWQKFVKEYPTEANELFLKTFNRITGK